MSDTQSSDIRILVRKEKKTSIDTVCAANHILVIWFVFPSNVAFSVRLLVRSLYKITHMLVFVFFFFPTLL